MYRENAQLATSELHNFVLNHGALGDAICSLPAIIKARKSYHESFKMRVWVPTVQMELMAHLLAPYGEFEIMDYAKFPHKGADRQAIEGFGPVSVNSAAYDTHTRNRRHMVDYAFSFLIDSEPENMDERCYPTNAKLGLDIVQSKKSYVVFPIGATSDNKLFKAHVMAPIMQWCLDHDYEVVIVGTKVSGTVAVISGGTEKLVIRDEVDKLPADLRVQLHDLREKTTLLQLRNVLGYAEAVVGVDGGTLHLAGTTDTNIVYAMGTTLPKHRYIPRRGSHTYKARYVVPRNLECAGCQSNWLLTSLDFRFCAYGDSKCMDVLDSQDFIHALMELGL